jgi:hypothetical protein
MQQLNPQQGLLSMLFESLLPWVAVPGRDDPDHEPGQ